MKRSSSLYRDDTGGAVAVAVVVAAAAAGQHLIRCVWVSCLPARPSHRLFVISHHDHVDRAIVIIQVKHKHTSGQCQFTASQVGRSVVQSRWTE